MAMLRRAAVAFAVSLGFASIPVHADVVTDWNEIACAITGKAGGGAIGHRLMAVVQVSVFDAVSAIEKRGKPYMGPLSAPAGASVEAAVAAANLMTLSALVPAEKATTEAAYQAAIAKIPDGAAKADGVRVGELAAARVLARAEKDAHNAPDLYQPHASPGVYVPTMIPVFASWPKRTPWVMTRVDQFRPGPPPALDSETWEKDLQEVKALGAKTGSQRTKEQTDIAQFWEETRPLIYHGVVRSVAKTPGRSVADNARLLGAASVAVDDALIAVFDAKYTYNFWRPITAIRNGDNDGNDATERDAGWTPLNATPMHPEYPSQASILAGLGSAAIALFGAADTPLTIVDSADPKITRTFANAAKLAEEQRLVRIWGGIHFRTSLEVSDVLGAQLVKQLDQATYRPVR